MTLQPTSIDWAIEFIREHSDGDLFPKLLEMEAIQTEKTTFISEVAGTDLTAFPPGDCRRFLVPKDDLSFRQATQLDPQDSIILTSLIHQYGGNIESRRLPKTTVFSYRFAPSAADGLYGSKNAWNDFWKTAIRLSKKFQHVLMCDISDFYNQIYHHTVENQLAAAGLPNQAIRWILKLLESTTSSVSRGVPVGPHAVHLIAEASMIPIDNSLQSAGINFIRYADDIIVFSRNPTTRRTALAKICYVLDKQQRLTLQRSKTRYCSGPEFESICNQMIEDRPINGEESSLLALIRKYTGGDPYKSISFAEISSQDWNLISEESIRSIIESYIDADPVDFVRLRWFFRRLAQIGHPGGVNIALDNLATLSPCFASICFYLGSVQSLPEKEWKRTGGKLFRLLGNPELEMQEYLRLMLISLFSRNRHMNHFQKLVAMFQSADQSLRREIILAATVNNAADWIRELKESYPSMCSWQKRAMLYAAARLPKDEKGFFIRHQAIVRPFEKTLAKWAKAQ